MHQKLRSACLSFVLLAVTGAHACSLGPAPAYEKFDPSEYVFYGRVIDYVSADLKGGGTAWGLKLEVVESINLPSAGAKTVEIYKFHITGPDCRTSPVPEKAARDVPIGTEFEIAASPFDSIFTSQGPIRLNVTGSRLNEIPKGSAHARRLYEADWSPPRDSAAYPDAGYDPSFELRKDMARLAEDSSEQRAKAILVRLLNFPYPGENGKEMCRPVRLARQYLTPSDAKQLNVQYFKATSNKDWDTEEFCDAVEKYQENLKRTGH